MAKDEAEITIKGLREANERLFEDQERLQSKYLDLQKSHQQELKQLDESIKKAMSVKINRMKQTFGQAGSAALFKNLEVTDLPTAETGTQTEDDASMMKIAEDKIVNAQETLLVPSVKAFEHEADAEVVQIQFDEALLEDIFNSEGAIDHRDMVEFDAIELVGRSSEDGRMVCRSPEPKMDDDSEDGSDGKHNYNKSISYRKKQTQRNRNRLISSKVSQGKGSPDPKEQVSVFNFLSFPDLGSPRRNLAREIEEMQRLKDDLSKLTKEQLLERIDRMNDEHRRTVASLKSKFENDLAISQALNKTTADKCAAEVARLEK